MSRENENDEQLEVPDPPEPKVFQEYGDPIADNGGGGR